MFPVWNQFCSNPLDFSLSFADFCKKKIMLMSAIFFEILGNFYKFCETAYHSEVAYQIRRLYYVLFKYKNDKKGFSVPHEFDRKQSYVLPEFCHTRRTQGPVQVRMSNSIKYLLRIVWQYWALLCMNFNWHQVMIERNSQIMHWYWTNINPGYDILSGVFKFCLSFTLWMQKWKYTWFWGGMSWFN